MLRPTVITYFRSLRSVQRGFDQRQSKLRIQHRVNDSSHHMRTDPDQLRYLIGFTYVPGIGRVKLSLLQSYFGDLERAWNASVEKLQAAGLDAKAAKALISTRTGIPRRRPGWSG
jgi:hypothetical protein